MLNEKLITCSRCQGNACHQASNEKLSIWSCFGCGFTSNSTMTDKNIPAVEETLPELYKAIKFIDDKEYHWYPNTVILDNKSMVFAEGKTKDDWKWSAVKAKKGKADMKTKKEFDQIDFMEALEYIGYFKQK